MFAPYVEAKHLRAAIITATNFRIVGFWPIAWTSHQSHYGLIAHKDSGDQWHLQDDGTALPPVDGSGIPRIIDGNGTPLPLDLPLPATFRP